MPPDAITSIPGLRVGHWTDRRAATGCTVVLCEGGAVAAVDARGGAPGTRETDLLRPGNLVERIHAVLLSGGSAFGLDAAAGVMRYLEEQGVGFPTPGGLVPIVVGAVLYDLSIGRADVRPDAAAGYAACRAAKSGRVSQGSVGAGSGATVGKALGMERAVKSGIGTASERATDEITVGALVAVNCLGEVIDPDSGRIVAGARDEKGGFVSTLDILRGRPPSALSGGFINSTIGVVATNARLNREQAYRLAVMAHDGLSRTVRPAHTLVDGDVFFSLATGATEAPVDPITLGALAARAMERAIVRAVTEARGLAGVPSLADLRR
ncbi:MAG: P1 family peptidase [Dehalococcoidia bacterium]|nr:MAG: P1 family peptidase [Dehalococcoidia bacterium]